jgi:outer membrane protein assembly factor BamD (BamD/ComL family)
MAKKLPRAMIDEVLLFNSIKTVATLSVLNKAIAKTQAMVFERPEREVYNEILTAINQTETAIADSIYQGVSDGLTPLIKS